ncbi:hypothetical protein HK098_005662 [Nowakowskiella sp. JEL0407]|nr:hypothetical protein HK098_005662 [Nowakowskiella sp. JEL0407]
MIHTELLAIKAIPNPFIADNEYKVQWVGECDWIYRTTFRVEKVQAKYVLSFDGLDTFTKIYLNGALIGETENMVRVSVFTRQQIEVDEKILKYDTDNVLAIVFESAWKKGKALEEEYGKRNLWNGDSSRLYVRKAQYHYGWDWGPVLMTCGPWRDVRLEFYTSRISDVYVTSTLSEQNTNADLHIEASIEHATTDAEVKFVVTSPSGSPVKEIVSKIGNDSKAIATISIESPALWWPAGYGAQSLYTVNASIVNKTTKIHSVETKYGIRSVRLVQRPLKDQPGTSFFFEINGKRIFCGGANWIPADSFVTRITDEKYEQWIKLVSKERLDKELGSLCILIDDFL